MADTTHSAPIGASNTSTLLASGSDSVRGEYAQTFDRALTAYIEARTAQALVPDNDNEADAIAYEVMHAAENFLMECPAPDARALLAKFEIVHRDDTPSDSYVKLLRRDLMRTAGVTISPVFIPESWLGYFRFFGGKASVVGDSLSLSFTGEKAAQAVVELSEEERKAVAACLAANAPYNPTWPEALAEYRKIAAREEALRVVHNNAERMRSGPDDPAAKHCEDAWTSALDDRTSAWRALASAEVSTIGELREKIAIIRVDDMLDGDSGEGVPVIDAIAADLAKMEG